MHLAKRKRRWKGGEAEYLYLRETYRPMGGQPRERALYLGPIEAEDLLERTRVRLRRVGYELHEIRVIMEAVRAFAEREERLDLKIGKLRIAWRDPRTEE